MKAILAPTFDTSNLIKEVKKTTKSAASRSKKKMVKTTDNFRRTNVDFIIETANSSNDTIFAMVAPKQNKAGEIWWFLNDGTDIRFAVMSDDFIPKTSPRTLVTVVGKGQFSHFDFENPRPGIEARLWTHIIAEVEGGRYKEEVFENLKNFVKDWENAA